VRENCKSTEPALRELGIENSFQSPGHAAQTYLMSLRIKLQSEHSAQQGLITIAGRPD